MIGSTILAAVACLLLPGTGVAEDAADRVVFRDGDVLLGQVVAEESLETMVAVRRTWAEEHLPQKAAAWERQEEQTAARARQERLARLEQWRRDRPADQRQADQIGLWIDREIVRLRKPFEEGRPPLMLVTLGKREILTVDRRDEDARRMLRQGWRAGFEGVESMPIDRLREGLRSRGFAMTDVDPAPIDDLMPVPIESDRRWLARRAATEILNGGGNRLVRYGDLVMLEPTPGAAVDEAQVADAVGALLGELTGQPAEDPVARLLRKFGAEGKVGAVLTSLEMAPGFERVSVESVLLVRVEPERWLPAATRRAAVSPGDLPDQAGVPLANDPQVESAFEMLERLGVGANPEARRVALGAGAATQKALQMVEEALNADLRAAAFDLGPLPAGADRR